MKYILKRKTDGYVVAEVGILTKNPNNFKLFDSEKDALEVCSDKFTVEAFNPNDIKY